ncbi:MAG: aminoacyl-tRNA hydrolase [Flavobacteriales bacterium]|nr:aminoacyl-tRNA hydrolase [Flavobacteriales bacterium]
MNLKQKDFSSEFTFKTSRSSGKGGQHVNKVESRISLFFNVNESRLLTEEEKTRLKNSSSVKLSKDYLLQIDVEESRSQHKNKIICVERFYELLVIGLRKPKARKITKPSKSAIRKRLKNKKNLSEKKKNRQQKF